jgi:opacity protein-like surface antigen
LNTLYFWINRYVDAGKFKIKPEFDIGLKYYKEINDRSGIGMKFGVGLSTELSKKIELGIGYKYQYIKWETLDRYYSHIDTSASLFDFTLFGRFKF